MIDFDPNKIYHEIVTTGEKWADKEAAADLLEETKKTVLAELMQGYQGSNAERERQALANPAFRLHITNMSAARKEANLERVRYDAVKVLAEMRRTQESTRRAEANIR